MNKNLFKIKEDKRPIGVSILGGWLIFQAFSAFGAYYQIGLWAYILCAIFGFIGYGFFVRIKKLTMAV